MSYSLVHRTPLDVAGSKTEGLRPVPFEEGLFAASGPQALLESPILEAPFPFGDLAGSWDAVVPQGGSLEMQAQVRAGGDWSPWFSLGRAEGERFFSADRQESGFGWVNVDTLKLKRPASAMRYRFILKGGSRPVLLRLAAATVSDSEPAALGAFRPGPWVRELKGRRLSVGIAAADLWSSPRQGEHLSQLLYGEQTSIMEVKGNWVRVMALEQGHFSAGGKWRGYSGWIRADSLRFGPAPGPNAVVSTRQALAHTGEKTVVFSLGTRLLRVSQSGKSSVVRLLDGSLAEMDSADLSPTPFPVKLNVRARIIKSAELFLGANYYWGGRSGVQADPGLGVDCSGLVSLAYRACGMDLPRDAHDQKLKSAPVSRRELRPADLVFLSGGASSRKITHVMIYTGGDGLIESRQNPGKTLRSSFQERFRKPRSEIESGDILTDYSLPKPRLRRIFFGAFLKD
ncbi:MAG: C40 family peptidase [Elusimicrobia bacterium]|nr:C40 family peptidase [Elusimicrobiota bacterium]